MKEQLFTIPVMDAFQKDCECPICSMYQTLEQEAINYTIGPSYMEDDIRAITDKMGFCKRHIKQLYEEPNRLGVALMLHTHLKKIVSDMEVLLKKEDKPTTTFFKKKQEQSKLVEYITAANKSCFICNKIEQTFERYIITIFYLYKKEVTFRDIFQHSKGVCIEHYGILYENASKHLSKEVLFDFLSVLNELYFSNMKRIIEDISWYIDKFDYRFANESWKNSKDAVPRTILKTNGIFVEQEKK